MKTKERTDMIITQELTTKIEGIRERKADNIFLFLDSSFSRLSLVKSYTGEVPLKTGELKLFHQEVLAYLDQMPLEFRGADFFFYYPRPLFITGIGLYGERFIKEIRAHEKKAGLAPSPIILYGSPKKEKKERIADKIDLHIDTRKPSAVQQLIYVLNQVGV